MATLCAIASIADENEVVNINNKTKETIIDTGRINPLILLIPFHRLWSNFESGGGGA